MCNPARKLLRRVRQETSGPVLELRSKFKKHGGMHTTHATKDCHRYEKDGTVKAKFCTAKKAGKKPNPAKQSLAQLSKKLDKLEKTLKKDSLSSKKCRRDNSNSDSK
jgi:hypothetical protein